MTGRATMAQEKGFVNGLTAMAGPASLDTMNSGSLLPGIGKPVRRGDFLIKGAGHGSFPPRRLTCLLFMI